jgi:hypothetical protein
MPHGYPDCFCEHGRKPELCGKCLSSGAVPSFAHKGTGNESLLPYSSYRYIRPSKSKEYSENTLLTELEQQNDTTPSSGAVKSESIEILRPPPRPRIDEPKIEFPSQCPHDGIIHNGITYCGHCTKDNIGAVATHIMYADLLRICRQEGRRHFYWRVANEDQVSHAIEAVWSKLSKICAANNPPALARTIARQAVSDLKRKAYNWKEVPNSDRDSEGPVKRSESDSEEGGNSWRDMKDFANRYLDEDGNLKASQIGGQDWTIPGGERFWNPPNIRQMEVALQTAMAELPRPPHDKVPMAVSMMIKRWVGYFPDLGEQSYDDIGKECYPQVAGHKVKSWIQKGIQQARRHILVLTGDSALSEINGYKL